MNYEELFTEDISIEEDIQESLKEFEEDINIEEYINTNIDNSFKLYIQDISNYELLTENEFKQYFSLYKEGQESSKRLQEDNNLKNDEKYLLKQTEEIGNSAKKIIIERNLRLVIPIAIKYRRKSNIDIMDLIQEGNMGLSRAVDTFDIEKGYKFSTYANYYIVQKIIYYLKEKLSLVRVPRRNIDELKKIQKYRDEFYLVNQRNPTIEELSKVSEFSKEVIEATLKFSNDIISLTSPINNDTSEDSEELINFIEDNENLGPEEKCILSESNNEMMKFLDILDERSKNVVILRLGLNGNEPMTLESIGNLYGLTKGAIRQIEGKAMMKLQEIGRRYIVNERIFNHNNVKVEDITFRDLIGEI